jgi:hypothetical protein
LTFYRSGVRHSSRFRVHGSHFVGWVKQSETQQKTLTAEPQRTQREKQFLSFRALRGEIFFTARCAQDAKHAKEKIL